MGIPGASSSSNNSRSDSDDWVPSIWEAVRHAIKAPTGQQGAILEGLPYPAHVTPAVVVIW